VAAVTPPGVGAELLLPGQKVVQIVAGGNCVLQMASTVTGPVNWPTVASLHRKQLIA
jgi:hypothetical protein